MKSHFQMAWKMKTEEIRPPPPPPATGEMQQVRKKKTEKKKQIEIRESPRSPLNGFTSSSSSFSSSVSSSMSSERLNRSRKSCLSFGLSHSTAATTATKPRKPMTAGRKMTISAKPLDRTSTKNPSKLVGDRPRKQIGQVKKNQKDTGNRSGYSTRGVFRKGGGGGDGCDGDTSAVNTASIQQLTPEKEEIDKKTSNTPTNTTTTTPTTTTPPIEASISPEIVGMGAAPLAPPICFAAGCLISGVPDGRKKCRPRGILKVGVDEDLVLATSSLARASIEWNSSPTRLGGFEDCSGSGTIPMVDFTREDSVNWLLPLPEDRTPRFESLSQSNDSCSWRFSPSPTSTSTTPSQRIRICKTPTSDSSISPFSMIIKNAANSVSANSRGVEKNDIQIGSPPNSDGDDVILTSGGSPSASKNFKFDFDCAMTASNSIDLSLFHTNMTNAATSSAAAKNSSMIDHRHETEDEVEDRDLKHDQSGFGSIELLPSDELLR